MELDDLQKTWRSLNDVPNQDETVDNNALRHILQTRSKTKGVLDSLRTRVLRETWLNILGTVRIFAGLVLENNFSMRLVFGGLFIYQGLMIFYFLKKLQLLSEFASPDETLRDYLVNMTTRLKGFLRVYKYGNALMIPPAFATGLYMGIHYSKPSHVLAWMLKDSADIVIKGGALVLCGSILFYFVLNWWTNVWYGVHIRHLEEYAKELED